jgi:hypothetical protein
LGAIIFRGFSENGFRLGSQLAWRYTSLVFFAALVAGPVCRIVAHFFNGRAGRSCAVAGATAPDRRPLLPDLKPPPNLGRKLVWGFCLSYGVYLLSVFLPNVIQLSAGATLMTLFGSGVVLVMAATAAPIKRLGGETILPEKFRRVLLAIAVIYFWLCYSAMALARISGPHRPDDYYGISLCLMILGLLARYADRWVSLAQTPAKSASI